MNKVKYAIFKGTVGLYAQEYIDTPAGLKHYPYIKPSSLPVIVNRVGGFSSYSPEHDKVIRFVEIDEDDEPLTREERYPKNSPNFEYGWISPDGDTYSTSVEGHTSSADAICKELGYRNFHCERYLEEMGWAKVTASNEHGVRVKRVYCDTNYFTEKQADTAEKLDLLDVPYVPCFIRSMGRIAAATREAKG